MALTVNVKKDFSLHEVSSVIRSALALDEKIAKHKKARYATICKNFETKYKMSSDIFMKKFDSGQLDDSDDFLTGMPQKRP